MGKTTSAAPSRSIVVAGDVCIDWLATPVAPRPASDAHAKNWQLRYGHHMYARHGGAWLTADLLEHAIGPVIRQPRRNDIENIAPEQIIHSILWLGKREAAGGGGASWMVERFDGFAGPDNGTPQQIPAVENDPAAADIVVLDDAGNGFRDATGVFPAALSATPIVLYKVRSPLCRGALWERISQSHLPRTIVVLGADELRNEGADISKELSWERTATDVVLCLARDPHFAPLRSCAHCIVTLGIEGALLIRFDAGEVAKVTLWYLPGLIEAELLGHRIAPMSGFGSVFTAAVAASLADSSADTDTALRKGIDSGLASMQALRQRGFGRAKEPDYPRDVINSPEGKPKIAAVTTELPDCPPIGKFEDTQKYRAWRIVDSPRSSCYAALAERVVIEGLDNVLPHVPVAQFGKLTTIDRGEIESFRTVRNLIREFLHTKKTDRPLSLAVFGPPGSGKSFGVKEVAISVAGKGNIERIEFNLSQWNDPSFLVHALHRVRDHALRGIVPLVFFDEFDSPLAGRALGWLKYFLAPMQDGVFADGLSTHQIGKAIFVFAGGTARSFAEFQARAQSKPDEARDAKLPDFLSRLRGHVDIFGFGPPCETILLRRAIVLRSNLLLKFPALEDADKRVRIHPSVVRAFLQVPTYRHGVRSMEAILDMSRLASASHFDPTHLPPRAQLDLHVDGRAFLALLSGTPISDRVLERIARSIHERYVQSQRATGRTHMPWDQLGQLLRNSNIEQAAFYTTLLAAAGCCIANGSGDGDGKAKFEFTDRDLKLLPQMEHERWMEERRLKQPDHPALLEWSALSFDDQNKDLDAIKNIPQALRAVDMHIIRVQ